MRRIIPILFLIFCIVQSRHATAQPTIEWSKNYGGSDNERATDLIQTTDGGYLLAGTTSSTDSDVVGNHGNGDAWLVKLNAQGVLQWQKCLGGSAADGLMKVRQTSDNGYVFIGGTTSNDGDVSGNHGDYDVWVVKTDSIGGIQWQKCYGGTSTDIGMYILPTTDGGYLFAALSSSTDGDVSGNHGMEDVWLVKINMWGTLQWQKSFGGTGSDDPYGLIGTSDGGYIVSAAVSSTDGDVSGNHGNNDVWVFKIDNTGAMLWQKCLGGSGNDVNYSIQNTADGGCIIANYTSSNDGNVGGNHGGLDVWVVKLDQTGTVQWQKCLGGTGDDFGRKAQQTTDGGYIVSGQVGSNDGDVSGFHGGIADGWIVKLDATGTLQWQKCLGGTYVDLFNTVIPTTDGGYVAAGVSNSADGDITNHKGGRDVWVVKLAGTTGIAETAQIPLNLYPNPAGKFVTLQTESGRGAYQVQDLSGRIVLEGQVTAPVFDINISALSEGFYTVSLRDGNNIKQGKLVKE